MGILLLAAAATVGYHLGGWQVSALVVVTDIVMFTFVDGRR